MLKELIFDLGDSVEFFISIDGKQYNASDITATPAPVYDPVSYPAPTSTAENDRRAAFNREKGSLSTGGKLTIPPKPPIFTIGAAPVASGHSPEKAVGKFRIELLTKSEADFAQPNKTAQFTLMAGNEEVGHTLVEWEVVGSKNTIGKKTGLFTASDVTPGVPATPTTPAVPPSVNPCQVKVTFTVFFRIIWPEDWPELAEGWGKIRWLDDDEGRLIVAAYYGLFEKLPEPFRKTVANIAIECKDLSGELFVKRSHYSPFFNTVVMHTWEFRTPPGGTSPSRYSAGYTFIHELAHAYMAERCGNKWILALKFILGSGTIVGEIIALVALYFGGTAIAAGTTIAGPLVALAIIAIADIVLSGIAFSNDYMTEYTSKTNWICDDLRWHAIPLLGWLFGKLSWQYPNYVLGSADEWNIVKTFTGLRNTDLLSGKSHTDAGMTSVYASGNPQEDYACAFTSYACHTSLLGAMGEAKIAHSMGSMTHNPRIDILEKDIFQTRPWKEILRETVDTYNEFYFAREPVRAKGFHTTSVQWTPEEEKQISELFTHLNALGKHWKEKQAPVFERNQEILKKMAIPVEEPSLIEFARKFEVHGAGVQLYHEGMTVEQGDFLIDKQSRFWTVGSLDEKGAIKELLGDVKVTPDTKPEDLHYDRSNLLYHWKPDPAIRKWVGPGQTVSTAYKNIDEVLTKLSLLWGRSEVAADAEPREIRTRTGFFLEIIRTAQLQAPDYTFSEKPDFLEVMNYMNTHGEGVQEFDISKAKIGDIVIPYHKNTIGIITGIDPDESTMNVLFGGSWMEGLIGEPKGSIQMVHEMEPEQLRHIWEPSINPRVWTN